MGYHGITWASINRPGASAPRLKRNLHGPLMGCPLKEWLRDNSPRARRETAPPAARGASHEINPWLTAGPPLARLRGAKHRERVAALASCSPAKEGFLFLDGTNAIGGHKMLRTLMISTAISAR